MDNSQNSNGNDNHQGDSCNVFVKFLPPSVDDTALNNMFSQFGAILSAKVMVNQQTGASLGYGFVRFGNPDEAARAIRTMNGYKIEKKTLLCKYSNAQPNNQRTPAPSNNLYIKPLLPTTNEEQLRQLFSPFGPIKQVKVMIDKLTGQSRQIGFVMFENQADAENALKRMSGYKWDPSAPPLTVKFAESDSEKALRKQKQRQRNRVNQAQPMPVPPGMYAPYPAPTGYPMPMYDPYTASMYNMVPPTGMSSGYPPFQPGVNMPQQTSDASANLFVFHLPADVDNASLYRLFAPFGSLESVAVITDKHSGESKGYGFVKYAQFTDAANAISQMNGFQVGNKRLKVSFKTKKHGKLSPQSPPPTHFDPTNGAAASGPSAVPHAHHSPNKLFGDNYPPQMSSNQNPGEEESRLVKLRVNQNEERYVKVPFPSSTKNNDGSS
eukprot:gb/GECH01013021.1/.p1 GENE.gb/GECH01013021.1/~~gb/GECH01013021.1/.p1  ORF type:complete len:438 (+),score=108.02 gb/GECH01013021.1/:1-1314(+)